jgi:hypothetical protein
MGTQTGFHYYLNWAKARIDEMDATLTSLEGKAAEMKAGTREKANQVVADLRKMRDDFRDTVNKQAAANDAAWKSVKAQLETEWTAFQAEVNNNIESFGKQVEQQRAVFRQQADAQLKAWRDVADQLGAAAKNFAAERRAEVDAVAKRMGAEAAQAEEKLRKLNQAGSQSWSALVTALGETRAVFDRANQAAQDAFRKAAA